MSSTQTLEGLQAGQYIGSKRLKISTGITIFPPEILTLVSTLEVLDLSGNTSLRSLPSSISQLTNLKIAFFSNCSFITFPKELAKCDNLEMIAFKDNGMREIPEHAFPKRLRWLILTGNEIAELPRSVGDCDRLEKCMLAGNRLKILPSEMRKCKRLGLLRLSCNKFKDLPEWLFGMPQLAFLSFAGNPFSSSSSTRSTQTLEEIHWDDLATTEILGQGASGIISKGTWTQTSSETQAKSEKEVAIKLFKGTLTSDGSPIDELHACITAGAHPNLISPLGSIVSHPSNTQGLVLELIPPIYKNLGLPPTMQTCTRDVFPENTVLSAETCMHILLGIANAAQHLHEKQISHGDLYAHNILLNHDDGHALLGDFGAATTYAGLVGVAQSELLERLEVGAFGHLVEDLLGLVERKVDVGDVEVLDEKNAAVLEGLSTLHRKCTSEIVGDRPRFGYVVEVLESI